MLDNCIKLSLAVVLVLGITAMPAAATTWVYVTGDGGAETSLSEGNASYNYGINALIAGGSAGSEFIGLIRFDDTLPTDLIGATEISANLRVQVGWTGAVPGNLSVHQITDTAAWIEGRMLQATPSSPALSGACWSFANYEQPDGYSTLWSGGLGAISLDPVPADTQAIGASTTVMYLDVTTIFKDWASGGLNNGIALKSSGTSATWFGSQEAPSYGFAPYVALEYTPAPPIPEPGTLALLALGALSLMLRRRRR